MSGPGVVRIGRKRSLPAIERFIVEPSGKRNKVQIQYVLQKDGEQGSGKLAELQSRQKSEEAQTAASNGESQAATTHTSSNGPPTRAQRIEERRIFHLMRPTAGSTAPTIGKRKQREHGIATFIERPAKRPASSHAENGAPVAANASTVMALRAAPAPPPPQQFKRPGKSAAKGLGRAPRAVAPADSDLESIAASLHQFALEEVAKEAKPKLTSLPRLTGQRSRELHRQRVAANALPPRAPLEPGTDKDMAEEEEADYVYDTYVLSSSDGAGAAQVEAQAGLGSVGYLVITEEDEAVWETYLEDEPSDKDWDSNEDDENAEDWYGADYPDEELASDDEFGRNAYAYRAHGASDDEEWDADDQSWNDDEYERQTNPWRSKSAQQFRKYLTEADEAHED